MQLVQNRNIAAIILAGGLSRRMGGEDKAMLPLGGVPIIKRIVQRLQPQVTHLALNANGDRQRFAWLGLDVRPDTVPGFVGPLAGILTGLQMARELTCSHVLVVPCDAPFLPVDLVASLAAAAGPGGSFAASGGCRHPVVSIWPVCLAPALRAALLKEGARRVELVLQRYDFAQVEWPVTPFDPFYNINDAAGLAGAEAVVQQWPSA